MDPQMLLPPESPLGYPAPFWFLELFKVLGFWLHMAPMHLWYAGTIIAVLLYFVVRKQEARVASNHLFKSLPLAVALGINFGIIPLLFIQVAYYQFFYPAGILIAWPWISVIGLLIAAYYGVYLYVLGVSGRFSRKIGAYAGWISAIAFITIGFIFTNNFSLMTRVSGWFDLFEKHNIASASTGFALNTGDPTLISRWLFMFGMAITTVAVFYLADSEFLSGKESEGYRSYTRKLSWKLYTLGLLWFVAMGSLYLFGHKMEYIRLAFANPVMRIIFPLTMASPGLPWLLITLQRKRTTRTLATATIVAQLGVLALNAVSRQWVQNMELSPYRDLTTTRVYPQTGAIIFFLIVFVLGLTLTSWMVSKVIQCNRANA